MTAKPCTKRAKLAEEARRLEGYDGDFGDEIAARIAELDKTADDTVAAMKAELGLI